MENPLELPPPNDPIQRIHALARDLAYGAVNGMWDPNISSISDSEGEEWISFSNRMRLDQYLAEKWDYSQPLSGLMLSFGYFEVRRIREYQTDYLLTSSAFALLDKPTTLPSVFVSYKQDQSSALALLIEARLKLKDNNIHVFIDKLLQPGDQWENRLQETISQSREFICLIGPETLKSKTVQDEIKWATESGCRIISICHNGYKVDENSPQIFQSNHAIIINRESAEEYELAMIKLLNSLGYSTI